EKNSGYEKKQQYLGMLATRKMEEGFLKKRFARYGINFNLERSFMTIVLKMDGYEQFCSRYTLENRALLSYGSINIVGELTGALFTHEAVDLDDGFIGILFNLDPSDDEEFTVKMEGLVKEIQDKAAQFLGVSYSVAIGDLLDEIAEVPESISQCMEALDYKL